MSTHIHAHTHTHIHRGATSIMNTYVDDKTMTRGGQEGKGMNKEKREKRGGEGKKNWFDRSKVARDFCSFVITTSTIVISVSTFDSKLLWIDRDRK